MNKRDIVTRIELNLPSIPRRLIDDCLRLILETIQEAVLAGESVELRGFGTFYPKEFHKTNSRHPKTGELLTTVPKRKVEYRPSRTKSVMPL